MLAAIGPIPLGPNVPPLAVAEPLPEKTSGRGAEKQPGAARPHDAKAQTAPRGSESRGAAHGPPPPPDPYALTGPTPAFEANVLDRDRAFRDVLARLELARSRADLAAMAGGAKAARHMRAGPAATADPAGETTKAEPAATSNPGHDAATAAAAGKTATADAAGPPARAPENVAAHVARTTAFPAQQAAERATGPLLSSKEVSVPGASPAPPAGVAPGASAASAVDPGVNPSPASAAGSD